MLAVKGFFNNGRFTPENGDILPSSAQAILIIEETPAPPKKKTNDFWHEFDKLVDESADEEMPEFPRLNFGREPIIFTED